MIKWTDIDSEVEEFQSGYRSGFVSIFKKYEGQETDHHDGAGRVVTVTAASFARRYGIAKTTFQEWIIKEMEPGAGHTFRTRPGPDQRAIEEAAAQAKAEAEAVAAERLAEALAEQERKAAAARQAAEVAANAAVADAKRQERLKAADELKAERERAKQEKLEALGRLEKQLKEAAAKQDVDLTSLTGEQKRKLAGILANDPDSADSFFKGVRDERNRRNLEEMEKAKAAAEARKYRKKTEEQKAAAAKASKAYEDSPLAFFVDKVLPKIDDLSHQMMLKPVTFSNMMYSGMTPHQLVEMTNRAEDIIVSLREQLFTANAENELADLEVKEA